MKIKHIAILISAFFMAFPFFFSEVKARVHCQEDKDKIVKILETVKEKGGTLGERTSNAAKELSGIPWAPASDNDSIATIMINLHGLDRMEFISTSIALAKASQKSAPTFNDFELAYENISRRKGEDTGFASQLFYGADWIVDNIYRGNIKEMTEYLTGGGFRTKTLDYLSRHADEFPAMKDSLTNDRIRMMEMGYRSHRIPHLKKQSISNKSVNELLEAGDIIILLAPDPDYDIYDIGIVEMHDGVPYLTHISHDKGEVATDSYPLPRLFKVEGQHFYGYRWLRPTE